jgi:hypothetical protein
MLIQSAIDTLDMGEMDAFTLQEWNIHHGSRVFLKYYIYSIFTER